MEYIGKIIKHRVEESSISKSEFARRINTTSQNIYGVFKRKSIDTNLLIKISQVLNRNFFQYYTSSIIKVKEEKEFLNSDMSIVDLSNKVSNIESELQTAQKEISLKDKIILLLEEKMVES